MAYDGATTVVGPAYVSEVKISAQQKPYAFVDVYFEEGRKPEEFRRIGLVVFGDDARKLADFAAQFGDKCMINLIGYITTRPYKSKGVDEKVSTGLEVTVLSAGNMTGDEFVMLQDTKYVAFRAS